MPKPVLPKVPPPAITAPGGHKPMPHADSPRVVASSAPRPAGRCKVDGWPLTGGRCKVCGTVTK